MSTGFRSKEEMGLKLNDKLIFFLRLTCIVIILTILPFCTQTNIKYNFVLSQMFSNDNYHKSIKMYDSIQ